MRTDRRKTLPAAPTTEARQTLSALLVAAALATALPGLAQATCTDGDPCDDGRSCTTFDRCVDGLCIGDAPAVPATCDWAVVGSGPERETSIRTGRESVIDGSICGERIRISGTTVSGDVATILPSGVSVSLRSGAAVEGQVVNPTRSAPMLPGTLLGDCGDAAASIAPTASTLDSPAFASTQDAGEVNLVHHGNLTLTATGPLQVVDFASLIVNELATITLDGNSIPGATFVLRVSGPLHLKAESSIVLTGGAAPERVIFYGREECSFARRVTGAGTVFCPNDSIKLDRSTRWAGALVGGGDHIDVRNYVELTHVPSEVPAFH